MLIRTIFISLLYIPYLGLILILKVLHIQCTQHLRKNTMTDKKDFRMSTKGVIHSIQRLFDIYIHWFYRCRFILLFGGLKFIFLTVMINYELILLWRWNINFDSGRLDTKYRKPSTIIGVNTYLLKGFTIYKETLEGKKWRMSKIPFKSKQFLSLSCLIRNNNTLPKQVITMELTIRSSGFKLFLELSMQNQTLLFSPLRKN